VLAVTWAIFSGLAGCFLIFALTTDHQAAHRNNNLILFFPTSLLLLLTPSIFRKRRFAGIMRVTSLLMLSLAIITASLNIFPGARQWDWDLIALALPIYFALAAAVWMGSLWRQST